MRKFIGAAMVIALMAGGAARAADPTDPIFQVERDFAAYTHEHGYTKGFFTYSAPEAVDFEPQAVKVHDQLVRRRRRRYQWRRNAVETAVAALPRQHRGIGRPGLGYGPVDD
ncbi:MAG: hypothetical protein WDN06_00840 [Asticcacaulis sp.]